MTNNTNIPKEFEAILEGLSSDTPTSNGTSRRDFLKNSGLLMVSFSMSALAQANPLGDGTHDACEAGGGAATARVAQGSGPYLNPGPDPKALDSFIAVSTDGIATIFNGKVDAGQGLGTAFRQLAADELDVAYENTRIIFGDSFLTVDQGGQSATSAVNGASPPLRNACAEARRILLDLASKRFGVPADQLTVSNGVISVKADASKKVTYGELIGGKRFNTTLTWNGSYGNGFSVSGVAKQKPVTEFKVVGKSIPREYIPLQATGRYTYVVDIKVPGMVHARSVKPPVAGAKLISVDATSVRNIPGLIKIVTKGNYVGVVFEREEQAILAAAQLKVNWQNPSTPSFPTSEGLYDYIRKAPSLADSSNLTGDVEAALASASRVIEATYEHPFTSHASFGPACAVVDPRNDQLTIWSGTQKPYDMRRGVAEFLGMPLEKVRCIWVEGPGSYGRNDAGDVGYEAALLAKELGRPVRLQWMRHEGTGWDPKGPAVVIRVRAGLDAQGNVIAYDWDGTYASGNNVSSREGAPVETLVGQMTGARNQRPSTGNTGTPEERYNIPNKRKSTHVIALPLAYESPLRVSNLRDPQGPQSTFAGESFIDELAAALKADPIQFRLKLLANPADNSVALARHIAVVKAAAQAYGWDTRPSPKPRGTGPILTGRGISYASRGNPVVATIAEVEVNVQTGYVRVKRFVCAHDCGLVINPEGLRNVVQANLLQSASRALREEVTFDTTKVTSVDWITYPILTHVDVPDRIDVVIVNGDPNPNRPDLPLYGAGEPSTKPTAAAIANAIFDATGVRIRRVPFSPERVKAALNQR